MSGNPSSIRRSLSLQPTPFITKVAARQPLRQSCMNSPSHTGCAVAELHIHTQYRKILKIMMNGMLPPQELHAH